MLSTTSETHTAPSLVRLAGWSALLCVAALLLNAGRRAGLIPDTHLGHALAPLAQVFGLFLVLGLYLRHTGRGSRLLLAGFSLNLAGLGGVLGIEYILNFIYPELDPAAVKSLQAGFTGSVITATSLVFLAGVLIFGIALFAAGQLPRGAIVLYTVGFSVVALRGVLPATALPIALVVGAAAVFWLGLALLRARPTGGKTR